MIVLSAYGTERTLAPILSMSAFGAKAAIPDPLPNVR